MRQILQLLQVIRPPQVLRDHHVVTGGQVDPGSGQGDCPGEQARGAGVIAPLADRAAQYVDVQIQG